MKILIFPFSLLFLFLLPLTSYTARAPVFPTCRYARLQWLEKHHSWSYEEMRLDFPWVWHLSICLETGINGNLLPEILVQRNFLIYQLSSSSFPSLPVLTETFPLFFWTFRRRVNLQSTVEPCQSCSFQNSSCSYQEVLEGEKFWVVSYEHCVEVQECVKEDWKHTDALEVPLVTWKYYAQLCYSPQFTSEILNYLSTATNARAKLSFYIGQIPHIFSVVVHCVSSCTRSKVPWDRNSLSYCICSQ